MRERQRLEEKKKERKRKEQLVQKEKEEAEKKAREAMHQQRLAAAEERNRKRDELRQAAMEGDDHKQGETIEDYKTYCTVEDRSGCDEREEMYIEKMKGKGLQECNSQLERLNKMGTAAMTSDLKKWLVQRKNILEQLTDDEL